MLLITGHRGALGSEPENTLRSFRRAVDDGCDEIELDLRVTADGELVVLHDATVDRTTNGSGAVADLTFAARTLITSSQSEILLSVRRLMPTADTGLILGRTPPIEDVITLCEGAQANWALCGINGLTPEGVADLHAHGLTVTAWPALTQKPSPKQ
ncbi:glycerophosphodiester phosphodiesterase [Kribbella qitaiheensis]|uniref:Glycerophosphodiester phosphodiesterase n=1 Tax=Kribbella qitaiheensis TaxID=1544730 RepID=A0A7G6X9S2_9ACTN|nr:glycerophosphodiester phosphodiesterase [Kribbella qitaiheensis]